LNSAAEIKKIQQKPNLSIPITACDMTSRTGSVEYVEGDRHAVQLVLAAMQLLDGGAVFIGELLVQETRHDARLTDCRRSHHDDPIAILLEDSTQSGRLELGRTRLRPSFRRGLILQLMMMCH